MKELTLPSEAIGRLRLLHLILPMLEGTGRDDPLYPALCRREALQMLAIMYGGSQSMARPAPGAKWLEELQLPIRHLRKDITFWQMIHALHTTPSYWEKANLSDRGRGFYEGIAVYACTSPEPE